MWFDALPCANARLVSSRLPVAFLPLRLLALQANRIVFLH